MNLNFIFISYSVIYAKYNYCFEVPTDQPLRYFDGKEWKFMKPRHNMRTKTPRHPSISLDLDWAELIKEIQGTEVEETTTKKPSCDISTTKTPSIRANMEEITTKRVYTKKPTVKTTTTKKITTEITTPQKIFIKPLNRITQRTTTKKALLKHSKPVCKLKLKCATTMTTDPRQSELKMITSVDWRDNWNYLRATKKPSPVTSKKYTLKATKMFLLQTVNRVTLTTTKKATMPTKITAVITSKKPTTTTQRPLTTIQKSTTTTKGCMTTNSKPVIKMDKQEDGAYPTGNWSNLLKEFLKFVELKKCQQPLCESAITSTTKPYLGYQLANNRKIMKDDDDIFNIMMDGVEIDDRLIEEDDDGSQIKDMFEYKGHRLNYESADESIFVNSEINNDYVQVSNYKSLKDPIKTRRESALISKKMGYLKAIQAKKDYVTSDIKESEEYLDQSKDNNSQGNSGLVQDYIMTSRGYKVTENIETKDYSDALKDMRADKNYMFGGIRRSEEYFDEFNNTIPKNYHQASETKFYLDVSKVQPAKENYVTSPVRGSKADSDEIKDSQKDAGVIADSELKYYVNALNGKYAKKGKKQSKVIEKSYQNAEYSRQQYKDDLREEPTENFNSMELNQIKDYAAPKYSFSTKLKSQTHNEDDLQDSDITFDLEA